MGKTADQVPDILPPYDRNFYVWDGTGRQYKQHDLVPDVGMAQTYAVLLVSDQDARPQFLTVQDNRITNLMAHQPIPGASVFDPRGKYLGRGGEPLAAAGSPGEVVPLVELAQRVEEETQEPTATFLEPPPERASSLEHVFWLREGVEARIALPADLTKEEADRLANFVALLPFAEPS